MQGELRGRERKAQPDVPLRARSRSTRSLRSLAQGRLLAPLVKARGFGMTPLYIGHNGRQFCRQSPLLALLHSNRRFAERGQLRDQG